MKPKWYFIALDVLVGTPYVSVVQNRVGTGMVVQKRPHSRLVLWSTEAHQILQRLNAIRMSRMAKYNSFQTVPIHSPVRPLRYRSGKKISSAFRWRFSTLPTNHRIADRHQHPQQRSSLSEC